MNHNRRRVLEQTDENGFSTNYLYTESTRQSVPVRLPQQQRSDSQTSAPPLQPLQPNAPPHQPNMNMFQQYQANVNHGQLSFPEDALQTSSHNQYIPFSSSSNPGYPTQAMRHDPNQHLAATYAHLGDVNMEFPNQIELGYGFASSLDYSDINPAQSTTRPVQHDNSNPPSMSQRYANFAPPGQSLPPTQTTRQGTLPDSLVGDQDADEEDGYTEHMDHSAPLSHVNVSLEAECYFLDWFQRRQRLPTRCERRRISRKVCTPIHVITAWFHKHVSDQREAGNDIIDIMRRHLEGFNVVPFWLSQEERIMRYIELKHYNGCGANPRAKKGRLKCLHQCGASFDVKNKSGWARHLEISEAQKIYECKWCKAMFHRDTHIKSHFQNKHPEKYDPLKTAIEKSRLHWEPLFRRECGFCPLVFTDWKRLHTHIHDHFVGKISGGRCDMSDWRKRDQNENDYLFLDYEDDVDDLDDSDDPDDDKSMADIEETRDNSDDDGHDQDDPYDDNHFTDTTGQSGFQSNWNAGGFGGDNYLQQPYAGNNYNYPPSCGSTNWSSCRSFSTDTSSNSNREIIHTPAETEATQSDRSSSVVRGDKLGSVHVEEEVQKGEAERGKVEEERIHGEVFAAGSELFDPGDYPDEIMPLNPDIRPSSPPAEPSKPTLSSKQAAARRHAQRKPRPAKVKTAKKDKPLTLIDSRVAAMSTAHALLLLLAQQFLLRSPSSVASTPNETPSPRAATFSNAAGRNESSYFVTWPPEFGGMAFLAKLEELQLQRDEYWSSWYGHSE